MKVDGITLLKMIKDNKLKDNTKINVLFDDGIDYELVSELKYQDNELIWEPGTFRVAMLYDDNYMFKILEEKPKKIDKMGQLTLQEYSYDVAKKVYNKLDEIIDRVNYLLEKEDD